MRIITTYINNSDAMYGGAYRRYMELINGFLFEGWEVHHISPQGFSNIEHENFFHHGISRSKIRPSLLPFFLRSIPVSLNIGKKNKVDAFILFSIFDVLIALIFRFFNRNTKVIYLDRGDTIKGYLIYIDEKYHNNIFNRLMGLILNNIEGFIYKHLDLVIFNSNVRRNEILSKFSLKKTKIITIYNNANPSWVLEKVDIAKKESKDIKKRWEGKRILVFVGNLFIEGRDLFTLLKAFKNVVNECSNAVLFIVGDGPDRDKLEIIINDLDLKSNVFLEGWKDNPFSYMLAADICIVTAAHEGCSNTILESIYFENLIIGSNVGGISKLLKYKELLFPPQDIENTSNKIISLLNDKEKFLRAKELMLKRKNKFVFNWNEKINRTIYEFVNDNK